MNDKKLTVTDILETVAAAIAGRNSTRDEDAAKFWAEFLEDNATAIREIKGYGESNRED